MEITRLSTKGRIILPKAIRDARAWAPGTEFTVEARTHKKARSAFAPRAVFPI
jgi:AbrB family looped-hinge helix DNA binding protein